MSFIGEVRTIPLSSLSMLEKVQMNVAEGGDFEELMDFLSSMGEDLGYDYSGSVIFDLICYLRERKAIDLEMGEMSHFTSEFLESQDMGVAVYSLLNQADRDKTSKALDPSSANEKEMQMFVEELHKPYQDQYKGYGAYMFETQKFIFKQLQELKKDRLLFIGVWY